MSIIDSLNNIFSFEKDREFIDELKLLKWEICKLHIYTIIIKDFDLSKRINEIIPSDLIFKELVKEKGTIDSKLVKSTIEEILKINSNLLFTINTTVEEKKAFYCFIEDLGINKELTNKANIVNEILSNIKENLILRITDDQKFTEKKREIKKLLTKLGKHEIITKDLKIDDALFNFIEIYYRNISQGKNTTLVDIIGIYEKIANSDIANKIILKFTDI